MNTKDYKKLNNGTALKKVHADLWRQFAKYIRLRDLKRVNYGGYANISGYCISCNSIWQVEFYSDKSISNGRGWVAGHYFLSNLNASTRYDERNVHLQCSRCNTHLHGNLAEYKIKLIKKIGKDEFEKLEILKHKIKHYDIVELERLTDEYKLKCKLRANELQIKI